MRKEVWFCLVLLFCFYLTTKKNRIKTLLLLPCCTLAKYDKQLLTTRKIILAGLHNVSHWLSQLSLFLHAFIFHFKQKDLCMIPTIVEVFKASNNFHNLEEFNTYDFFKSQDWCHLWLLEVAPTSLLSKPSKAWCSQASKPDSQDFPASLLVSRNLQINFLLPKLSRAIVLIWINEHLIHTHSSL